MLPDAEKSEGGQPDVSRLNAPDGAGCSLTGGHHALQLANARRLNAPDGAGCSLTVGVAGGMRPAQPVSMHLMVLGAP